MNCRRFFTIAPMLIGALLMGAPSISVEQLQQTEQKVDELRTKRLPPEDEKALMDVEVLLREARGELEADSEMKAQIFITEAQDQLRQIEAKAE